MNYSKRWVLWASLACVTIILSCSSNDDSPKNQAPNDFKLIEIADGTTDGILNPKFSWNASTDPDGDTISYDLYLDTKNPPTTLLAEKISETNYIPTEPLEAETTYYWSVVANDGKGGKTKSKVFNFTTKAVLNPEFLLGKWFMISSEGQDPATTCEKTSYTEFSKNGKNYTILYTDNSEGQCIPLVDGEHNFELISETKIKFTHDGDGDTFETEILSLKGDTMVIKGFLVPESVITLKKAS